MLNYNLYELMEIKSLRDLQKNQEDVKKDLFDVYTKTTKANKIEIGFIINKKLYSIKLNEIKLENVKLTTESRGGLKLKLAITKRQKLEWLTSGKAKEIMDESKFLQLV